MPVANARAPQTQPGVAEIMGKIFDLPDTAVLAGEIRALRVEVAELRALLAPPSSTILTGRAVVQEFLALESKHAD